MGPRRRLSLGLALAAAGLAGWLAVPRRFEVEGVSMGPALLPGDVVRTGLFPAFDRLRRPRRFERWVLAAADGLAIKRVVGLPGEEVAIVAGDLAIDGAVVLKGPRLLADLGLVVADDAAGSARATEPGWTWSRSAAEILDDAPFDADTTRVLGTVRDAGLAALVDVRHASSGNAAEVRLLVGDTVLARPLPGLGRHAVVAGHLDGHLVIATWSVPGDAALAAVRSCLPAGPPERWSVADPLPESPSRGDSPPRLALALAPQDRATLVAVGRWRDVAWRPAADGRSSWQLGPAEVFVLGDHPPASTDSRRWGPVMTRALRHRAGTRSR